MHEHKTVWEGKHLRVRVCGHWEYAERTTSPAGIVIVAVTPAGKLLLVEQFRIPLGKNVIELPAGLAGDENYSGEEFAQAAKRELLEETGYEAARWEELTAPGPPSAGFSNELIAFFLAKDLRKVARGGGHGTEKIIVHEIPLAEVPSWLKEREKEGMSVDPKVYAGLFFAAQ